MLRNLRPARLRVRARQAGLTLIEVLVAMVISLVVAMAMVSLMANTMGTGTRTIQMSRLTAELRAALQIMTRDVRRANYHGNFVAC
ncbi:MAG: prepilin-type N-terminal cleavage/methylation domain-containing protein, partial [Xanthomonadales bacterium]|nr:prepilin-type N-terminal cleavage/methylation domain-containing protein [Xanthomonadales bacterium]NIX12564.1 prepilin-type N-terminal cleavage/methylation domain-containing protein [Xanthomonadales bacterium]